MKKWIIGSLLLLLLAAFYVVNCTDVNLAFPHVVPHRYVDDLGGFDAETKFKVMTYDHVISNFDVYSKESPQKPTLYRCHKRNWLYIWDWVGYLTHPSYDLPYKECDPPKQTK